MADNLSYSSQLQPGEQNWQYLNRIGVQGDNEPWADYQARVGKGQTQEQFAAAAAQPQPQPQQIGSSPIEGLQAAAPGGPQGIATQASPINPVIPPGNTSGQISSSPVEGLVANAPPPPQAPLPVGAAPDPGGLKSSSPASGRVSPDGGATTNAATAPQQPAAQNTSAPPHQSSTPPAGVPTFSQTQATIQASPTWQGNPGGKQAEPPAQPNSPIQGLQGAMQDKGQEIGVKPPTQRMGMRQQPRPLY